MWIVSTTREEVIASIAGVLALVGSLQCFFLILDTFSAISSSAYLPLQLNSLTSREKNLQLFRSAIHAWGVRTLEPLCEGDLVIEYIGECISARVADNREKRYERIGIGSSYFFKISDDLIIDATRKVFSLFQKLSCLRLKTGKFGPLYKSFLHTQL